MGTADQPRTTPDPDVEHLSEARAAGRLAGDALAGAVETVAQVHRGVSDAVDRAIPAALRPWRPVTARATAGIYALVAGGARVAPRVAVEASAAAGRAEAAAPSRSRLGRGALATINGLWTTELVEAYPPLVTTMSVRVGGRDVSLDPDSVAAAFPEATGRLAVFVHGLAETEESWQRRPRPADDALGSGTSAVGAATPGAPPGSQPDQGPTTGYGDRLATDLGMTPVYVRYPTGRPVADNGRELADLLQRLVAAWPMPVESVDLVGHSMGGLVARAACHAAADAAVDAAADAVAGSADSAADDIAAPGIEPDWLARTRSVITLGTPHRGAPLASAVGGAERVLAGSPITSPLAARLRDRSAGVDDLRLGRPGTTADPVAAREALRHVRFHAVSATVTRRSAHPAGVLLGDGLVGVRSATRSTDVPQIHQTAHVGGANHLDLLNHEAVYRALTRWLAP